MLLLNPICLYRILTNVRNKVIHDCFADDKAHFLMMKFITINDSMCSAVLLIMSTTTLSRTYFYNKGLQASDKNLKKSNKFSSLSLIIYPAKEKKII